MNPINFLETLYLGDRYCTKMIINSQGNLLEVHVNLISRVRDVSGEWNFYTDEDIENGIIVFFGLREIHFDQSGLIPNDELYNIKATKFSENVYEFIIETSNVSKNALTTDLMIKVLAEGVYLLDPNNPEKKIII